MRLTQKQKLVLLIVVIVVIVLWAVFNPNQAKNDLVAILDSFWETIKHIAQWIVSSLNRD